MELRARIRPHLRRATFAAASVALLASATAGLAATDAHAKPKKKKAPRITAIAPKHVAVGQTLTIRGRNFLVGRSKNTVVFKREGARAVFAKADVSTKKVLRVKVPGDAPEVLRAEGRQPRADGLPPAHPGRALRQAVHRPQALPDRLRAGADRQPGRAEPRRRLRQGRRQEPRRRRRRQRPAAPTPPRSPSAPCRATPTATATASRTATSSSRRRTSTTTSTRTRTRSCPTPASGRTRTRSTPTPAVDYDGDSLTLANEQALWRYSYAVSHMATRTLTPLSYSDGMQYSLFSYESGDHGRRHPAQPFSTYPMQARSSPGRRRTATVRCGSRRAARTTRRSAASTGSTTSATSTSTARVSDVSEANPTDDGDGWVSDDERDEDADGLTTTSSTAAR